MGARLRLYGLAWLRCWEETMHLMFLFLGFCLSCLDFFFFFFLGSGRQGRKCQAWLSLGRSIDSRGT